MSKWLQRMSPLALILALALTVSACAPADTAVSASAAQSAQQSAQQSAEDAPAFVAPQRINPNSYVANYMETGADHILIDVREPHEFNSGHIAGAINIPLGQIPNRLSEIPRDTQVILYCRTGNRSDTAASVLASAGYSGILDLGGVVQWAQQGYPLQ